MNIQNIIKCETEQNKMMSKLSPKMATKSVKSVLGLMQTWSFFAYDRRRDRRRTWCF